MMEMPPTEVLYAAYGLFAVCAVVIVWRVLRWLGRMKVRRDILNGKEYTVYTGVPYGSEPDKPTETRVADEVTSITISGHELLGSPVQFVASLSETSAAIVNAINKINEIDDDTINGLVVSLRDHPEQWVFGPHKAKHTQSKIELWHANGINCVDISYDCGDEAKIRKPSQKKMLWDAMKERALEAQHAKKVKDGLQEKNAIEAARKHFGA